MRTFLILQASNWNCRWFPVWVKVNCGWNGDTVFTLPPAPTFTPPLNVQSPPDPHSRASSPPLIHSFSLLITSSPSLVVKLLKGEQGATGKCLRAGQQNISRWKSKCPWVQTSIKPILAPLQIFDTAGALSSLASVLGVSSCNPPSPPFAAKPKKPIKPYYMWLFMYRHNSPFAT